jgi:hypothetical protein
VVVLQFAAAATGVTSGDGDWHVIDDDDENEAESAAGAEVVDDELTRRTT